MKKSFIEKIKRSPAIGTIITLHAQEMTEIASQSGLDWLFFDMEHGTLSIEAIQHLIQSMDEACSAIVRIPENSSVWIKKVLDTGCDGIIVPQVNTVEDARRAIAAAKYPPQGGRSVGIARAQGYGANFEEYIKNANKNIAVIIQIEHIDGVNNLDEILSIKGISGVLIGPYDLSGSMGVLGQVSSKPVQDAINIIKTKCKKAHIPFGIFVMKPEAVKKEIDDGCSFVAAGIDTVVFGNAVGDIVKAAKHT